MYMKFHGASTVIKISSAAFCRCKHSKLNVRSFMTTTPTVNEDEVNKFNKIKEAWCNATNAECVGPLHAMNHVRVKFIRYELAEKLGRPAAYCDDYIKGLNVLDVGCRGGLLSESLARLGAKVTGIDPSPHNIEIAEWHSKQDCATYDINYIHTSVDQIADEEKKFDVVCSLEVLEHVEDVRGFVSSCFKCLKPNGSLFLSTLNRTSKSYLVAILGAEYLTRMVPIGTHDWNKFIKPHELQTIVENENGEMRTARGMVLQPTFNPGRAITEGCTSWKLSRKDFDVNYIVHCMKK